MIEKTLNSKTRKLLPLALIVLLLAAALLFFRESLFSRQNVDAAELERFFRVRYGVYLPDGFTVKAVLGENSEIKGFGEGSYEVGFPGGASQSVPFLASLDGKHLILGEVSAVDINEMEKTNVRGMRKGFLPVDGSRIPILISKNREKIIVGKLENVTEDPALSASRKISLEKVPSKGSPEAVVNVVEYSDFQCPYCAKVAKNLPPLLKDYEDKVRFFYKQFPLTSIHPWAEEASIASICVYDQSNEKFWQFHDAIFKKQAKITRDNATDMFSKFARDLSVDMEDYTKCTLSEDAALRVASDLKEGRSLGVNATPTFAVDGFVIPGADMTSLRKAIDYRLSSLSGESAE